jgi:hypothetical protein
MVKYTFSLKIKDSNEEYKYVRDLQPSQENNPEKFLNSEIREHIRDTLQRQSSCKIDDRTLNRILKTWGQDIKEGYRDSSLTLDLPSAVDSHILLLNDSGNQQIPDLFKPDLSSVEPKIGSLPPLIFI